MALALLDGQLDVKGADHTVLGGTHWQVYKTSAMPGDGQLFTSLYALPAVVALAVQALGVTSKRAISHDFDFGQQRSQRPSCGTFGGTSLSSDQYTADLRADCVQKQGHSHPALTYDGSKRES
jgi:hypothetical protein